MHGGTERSGKARRYMAAVLNQTKHGGNTKHHGMKRHYKTVRLEAAIRY